MSFINTNDNGKVYAPGWFLAKEECRRETREIPQSMATTVNGAKYVKMGTPYPSNDSYCVGIVYEDVDVTTGNMPGSVVTKGAIYKDRLPVVLDSDAATALAGLGFTIINSAPAVTRPTWAGGTLTALTVNSAEGTNIGDTAVTVSGATPPTGGGYVYKVADSAPVIGYGELPGATWTEWDGNDDITAATGKYITVAIVDADGLVIAAGSKIVTAKAAG